MSYSACKKQYRVSRTAMYAHARPRVVVAEHRISSPKQRLSVLAEVSTPPTTEEGLEVSVLEAVDGATPPSSTCRAAAAADDACERDEEARCLFRNESFDECMDGDRESSQLLTFRSGWCIMGRSSATAVVRLGSGAVRLLRWRVLVVVVVVVSPEARGLLLLLIV